MLTDAHAHLCDHVFDDDREQVLKRARDAGVGAIIGVGETLADARTNLALAQSEVADAAMRGDRAFPC